jgi:hypothetical protein
MSIVTPYGTSQSGALEILLEVEVHQGLCVSLEQRPDHVAWYGGTAHH